MAEKRIASSAAANEIRTRFVPKSRIRSGLVSMSPWLDLVLLLIFVLFIESRIVLQPGIVVDLPETAFVEGAEPGMVVVVTMIDGPEGKSEIIFFDDESYVMGNRRRMDELKAEIRDYRRDRRNTSLTLYADNRVAHGTVTRLVQMARDVGVEQVNLGSRVSLKR
jgi:biopolymer transport protein ExbD